MATNSSLIALGLLQAKFPGSVYLPGSDAYNNDIYHWQTTSTQPATCSVEPASVDALGEILKIIGRDDVRSPFAIKSGGHALNVGFSSTDGVQISLNKFTELKYDEASQTVKIGTGLTWYEVYVELEKLGVTVTGGRSADHIGAGLALGGGFSWITDEYGLAIDNIISFDVVLPDGSFVEVTESTEPDLFFALRGGLNKFGVVTAITMKTHPMGSIWAGSISYSLEQTDRVMDAIAGFSTNNTNVKTAVEGYYSYAGPTPGWRVLLFHNGNGVPDVFAPFLDIPSVSKDVGPQNLTTFLQTTTLPSVPGGASHTVPIARYTVPLLKKIQVLWDQTYAKIVEDGRSITSATVIIEPFINPFKHSSSPAAYPVSADRPLTPSALYITFSDPQDATYFHESVWNVSKAVLQASIEEGQSKADDIHYPNYSMQDTPLELVYGENLDRLRGIRAKVDPKNVMGLTGGFDI